MASMMPENLESAVQKYKNTEDSDEKDKIYSLIEKELLVMAYFFPQKKMKLPEEEASDFLLFCKESFRAIVDKFNPKEGEFIPFFYGVLRKKIIAFKSGRVREKAHDSLIYSNYYYYTSEEVLRNEDFEFLSVSEKRTPNDCSIIPKLVYLLKNSITFRKRMFMYLMTIGPFMSVDYLTDFCETFNIEINGTLEIVSFLEHECKDMLTSFSRMEARRNFYADKVIETQKYLSAKREEGKDTAPLQESLGRFYDQLIKKNSALKSFEQHVPYALLARVLGQKTQTIGSQLYYFRLGVHLCSGGIEGCSLNNCTAKFGLSKKSVGGILSGRWAHETQEYEFPVFNPYDYFAINIERE